METTHTNDDRITVQQISTISGYSVIVRLDPYKASEDVTKYISNTIDDLIHHSVKNHPAALAAEVASDVLQMFPGEISVDVVYKGQIYQISGSMTLEVA
jgi:hypothetical protein